MVTNTHPLLLSWSKVKYWIGMLCAWILVNRLVIFFCIADQYWFFRIGYLRLLGLIWFLLHVLIISFRALAVILEIGVHLNVVNLSLIWFIRKERDAKIFEDKGWLIRLLGFSLLPLFSLDLHYCLYGHSFELSSTRLEPSWIL